MFLFILVGMFMLSFSSALEFDNVGSYNEETKTIVINNCDIWIGFCLNEGEVIGGAQLNTPDINYLPSSADKIKIAEFDLWANQDYNDVLKNLNFYDKNTKDWAKNKFQRDFDIKYKTIEVIDNPIYDENCYGQYANGTASCEQIVTGYYQTEIETWHKVTPADLKKNDRLTMGIFTEVKMGDNVEWILDIYGVRVTQWATFIQSSGTNYTDGNYTVQVFTSDGYFNITEEDLDMEILVIAGGAGGGTGRGGGGGAGGYQHFNQSLSVGNYNVVVGAGGIKDANGSNSVFDNITAIGGGAGGGELGAPTAYGSNGGSGGGGAAQGSSGYIGGDGIVGQGNDGGDPEFSAGDYKGGGGGGAGAAGVTGEADTGNGGDGLQNSINGTAVWYAGGGGAGANGNSGAGGQGGGGDGKHGAGQTGDAGVANTGGGGGGGAGTATRGDGGAGGSGIVILRYLTPEEESIDTELITPENLSNSTQTILSFNFTSTPTGTNLTNATLYLWNETDNTLVLTNFTILSGNESVNTTFQNNLSQGGYLWNAETCGVGTGCTFAANNNSFVVHITPLQISITEPVGLLEYSYEGKDETLTWNLSEGSENLTEHVTNCSYTYNGSTTYITIDQCVNVGTLNFTYAAGVNNITFTAVDEFELSNTGATSWSYKFLEINRTFNAIALQTATETFQLTGVRDSSITSTTAVFHYNGNEYTALKTGSGNNVIFTNVIAIPISLSGNISLYWTVNYTNSTGTFQFNTTNSTQEVVALSLQECFAPSTDGLTLNFTTYDTTNATMLNSTFEATFQFFAEGGAGEMVIEYLFSDLNENRSNYMFCLNSSGQNVTLDAFISYAATDFDSREYIINDGIIGNFTQDIPLYLTETALTDIVTITVQDQSYDPITGALVAVQEWNVGTNTYSTIGMLTTSSSGQGIIDLELYTTWYRAVVSIDGAIAAVTDVEKRSSTSWIITVETGEDNPYDIFGNIARGLTFDNETNITSFTWLDVSGYTNRGCLVVQNTTSLGPETIFNSCTSSVSGTIDYQISGNGNFVAYGIVFLEGYNVSQIVDVLNIRIGTSELIEKISQFGKVISFIAVGTAGLIGVAAESAILGGALVIAVLVLLMYLGFLNITSGFIWGMISIMIIVWVLQRRKK